MPIPSNIIQLTALALKDKVLTLVEKETIINAALKSGVSQAEITAWLDNALKESLKRYSKEDLKNCPFCGAQIPLVSEDCLFCGNNLQNTDDKTVINISGDEADIIARENQNTATSIRNIKNCPDCGAPFPLISNICTHCGHVLHEQTDSQLNIKNLITNIKNSISALKVAPKPTVLDVLKYRKAVVCFLISAALMATAMSFLGMDIIAGIVGSLSTGMMILAFVFLLTKPKEMSPVKKADDEFYNAIHTQEMYSRQIATLYGGNDEAKDVLKKFSQEISDLKQNRNKNRNILSVSGLIIIAVIVSLPWLAPSAKTNLEMTRKSYPEVFENAKIKTVLKPYGNNAFEKYFKPVSDADLSFDFQKCFAVGPYFSFLPSEKPDYKLRIDNVKIVMTGEKLPGNAAPKLKLLDKNFKTIGKEFYPLRLETTLEGGYESYYAAFVSENETQDIDGLKNVAENAVYYTIY